MAELIKCEPDLTNMIAANPSRLNENDSSSRLIKIERPPELLPPPKAKKQKLNPSEVNLNLKTTRNKNPKKKTTAQPKGEADATPKRTPKEIPVRLTPQDRRLQSRDKKRQGLDIRQFGHLVPRKLEIENQPPVVPLPGNVLGKMEVGDKSGTETETTSDAQATEPTPLPVVGESVSMDLSVNAPISDNSEMVITNSPIQEYQDDGPTMMDCDDSGFGNTPPNLGSQDFVVFDETDIIITGVQSIQGTIIPPMSALSTSTIEVKLPVNNTKSDQESKNGDDIIFQPPKEPRDSESDMTSTAPSETPDVKNPVTQIDEVSSTGARSRTNSSSSTSSRLSLKGKRKGSDCQEIDVALKGKNWNCVFKIFHDRLNHNMSPKPSEIAQVIGNCLLKSDGRVSSHTQCLAGNFFAKFAESATRTDVDLILEALALVESGYPHDKQNCYWEVISKIFDQVKDDAENKLVTRAALSFLQTLFSILNKSYHSYLKKTVKLSLPAIARIFVGPESESNALEDQSRAVKNFKGLLRHLFQLENYPNELQMSIDWVNLAASHFYNYYISNNVRDGLTDAFVQVVFELKQQDYGLTILRKLKKNVYVQDIILNIVKKEFPVELQLQPKSIQLEFLEKMSESRRITVHDIYENVTKGSKKKSFNNGNGDPWETTNKKGESQLHIACGDKQYALAKNIRFQDLQDRVLKMKEDQIGDINVLDNAMNTPLHDAAYHGRDDVMCLFRDEQLYIPNADPGPLNLNLLAKNDEGNTPLHLAAQKGHKMFIQTLVSMCHGEKDKICKLLESKNKGGQTPLDICDSTVIHSYLKEHMPDIEEEDFMYANIQLTQNSIQNFDSKTHLQKLIAYWRHVHRKIV